MLWSRWIVPAIPAALAVLGCWSAHEAKSSREARGPGVIVASGEGVQPTLNPYQPVCEVDRQYLSFVHAPLLQIGSAGTIEGGLADKWFWSQFTSFWFANEDFAAKAAAKIKALTPEQWARWQITSAEARGNELLLLMEAVDPASAEAVQSLVAEFGPLPVETIRVDLKEGARSHHEFFLQSAVENSQVKDVWFDGPTAYEVRVAGETVKFFQELDLYYKNQADLGANLRIVKKDAMLQRPMLEMVLKKGVTFHDGNPVTSSDVEATVALVKALGWPVAGQEALNGIDTWDTTASTHVRVGFRNLYGPSLMAFVGLPILPKIWIDKHKEALLAGLAVFRDDAPPGAGPFKLDSVTPQQVVIRRVDGNGADLQFVLNEPGAEIRFGFAMKQVDAFWPHLQGVPKLARDPGVKLLPPVPRNRLLVLWNCRSPLLRDDTIRQALGMAVDRQMLVSELLNSQGSVQEGIFQPGSWLARDLKPSEPDPLRAKQMLYERGWTKDGAAPMKKEGRTLRFELLTMSGNPERTGVAQRLRAAWEALGVEVVVTEVPWAVMVEKRLPEGRFDAVLVGFDFETSWDQFAFWHTRGALNFSQVSDPALDALLLALNNEYQLGRVKEMAGKLEDEVLEAHAFFPLFSGGTPLAVRREVFPKADELDVTRGVSLREALQASDPTRGLVVQPGSK